MNVTFIGGGNMASALVGGLLRKGVAAGQLRVVEVSEDGRRRLEESFPGVRCFAQAREAVGDDDVIVFAVKPQQMRQAAQTSGLSPGANLVISIAAGITLASLSRWLGGHRRLVRAMPNTPALIGEGITALYPLDQVDARDRQAADAILGAVGETEWVGDEPQMDAVTALSGSGPAYVFYFIEALERAGRQVGLPADTARKLVLHTFIGAARLAAASAEPVETLRARVTSKGGTTERALASMAADHVQEAIVRAVHAAAERSRELGDDLGKAD